MPIYKITGEDGYANHTRELYIIADTEQEAQRAAMKRGVVKGASEHCLPEDVPEGVPVLRASSKKPRSDAPALETHPVRTIALGVFCGLVAFTLFSWLLALLLSAIGLTLFGAD